MALLLGRVRALLLGLGVLHPFPKGFNLVYLGEGGYTLPNIKDHCIF